MAAPRCPICKAAVPAEATTRPFCSSRCRLIDLGNWLGDRYRIEGEPSSDQPPPGDDQGED